MRDAPAGAGAPIVARIDEKHKPMFVERLTPERPFSYDHDKQMYVLHRSDAHSLPRSDMARPWRLRESALWRVRWAILALAATAMLGLGYARAADPGWPGAAGVGGGGYQTITVAQGDTLWTIATRRYPDADPRQKVGEIERANGLAGPVIEPGQRVQLPAT